MVLKRFKKPLIVIALFTSGFLIYCLWFSLKTHFYYAAVEQKKKHDSLAKSQGLLAVYNPDIKIDQSSLRLEDFPDADPHPYYIIENSISRQSHLPDLDVDTFQTISSKKNIAFYGDTFINNSQFKLAKINCNISFNTCKLAYSDVNDSTTEYSGFEIQQISFTKELAFVNNDIYNDLSISSCQFNAPVSFLQNRFYGGNLFFNGSYFTSGVNLSDIVFKPQPHDKPSPLLLFVEFNQDTIKGKLDISHLNFGKTEIKTVTFYQTAIDSIDVSSDNLVDTLYLQRENIQLIAQKQWWVRNHFFSFIFSPFFDTLSFPKTKINLTDLDIKKAAIDYSLFQLYFKDSVNVNKKSAVYVGLLDKYAKNGETENYKLVDIDYHNFQGGFFSFFSKYWWNYGYSKWLIFIWCLFFIGVFSLINYLLLPKIYYTYPLLHINNYHHWVIRHQTFSKKNKKNLRYFTCLIYTCILFFGIKLELSNLKFYKLSIAIFILFQFTIGLICTGFIIHLIVQ
ncbi:hypothetical protein [Mucilaginibacter sp. OK098]|uniref:hypothetical protein n=1 Tax=Mucilaginibacter sp. OK098 TaxID=1855297 RepID=UPI0009249FD8|nr:hypothetical protein [Mucilaginibacter sp. OK098]SHM14477.1 hypothetical protein SAMN05216524_101960 [Mucilaginibacter sp. OK098]